MRKLRIGINALYLIPGGVGGTEIYLRNLVAELAALDTPHRYVVFTNRETRLALGAANVEEVPAAVPGRIRPARLLWEQTALPWQVRRLRLDVLLNPGFTAPLAASCPQVTVFHDMQHKRYPEHFRRLDLLAWRLFLYAAARRSRLVLADSDETWRDLRRYYRLPEDQLRVVPLGVEARFFHLRRRPEPFVLAVSTLHPHKNFDKLLWAFAQLRRDRPEFRLVVAGLRGFAAQAIERARRAYGLESAVEFTGWIPREQLYDLYARAWAFIYPSTFEGFGLPVLEAMAAGVPTACSLIEPLRSIGGDATLQFDPWQQDAIAAALERVVCDETLRADLSRRGPERAALFPWRATAVKTLSALEEAAGPRAFVRHPRPDPVTR